MNMLTSITYNCTPDSLGDVSHDAFVEAFENEMRAVPSFGDLSIRVTFTPAVRSEVTAWGSDDHYADADLENTWRAHIERVADRAFDACLIAD